MKSSPRPLGFSALAISMCFVPTLDILLLMVAP